jgi:hypothetical protein
MITNSFKVLKVASQIGFAVLGLVLMYFGTKKIANQ